MCIRCCHSRICFAAIAAAAAAIAIAAAIARDDGSCIALVLARRGPRRGDWRNRSRVFLEDLRIRLVCASKQTLMPFSLVIAATCPPIAIHTLV